MRMGSQKTLKKERVYINNKTVKEGIKSHISNKLVLRQRHLGKMLIRAVQAATQVLPLSFGCQIYIGTVSIYQWYGASQAYTRLCL